MEAYKLESIYKKHSKQLLLFASTLCTPRRLVYRWCKYWWSNNGCRVAITFLCKYLIATLPLNEGANGYFLFAHKPRSAALLHCGTPSIRPLANNNNYCGAAAERHIEVGTIAGMPPQHANWTPSLGKAPPEHFVDSIFLHWIQVTAVSGSQLAQETTYIEDIGVLLQHDTLKEVGIQLQRELRKNQH